MLRSGDVLIVDGAHLMDHHYAEAGAVREEHCELGHGSQAWHLDGDVHDLPAPPQILLARPTEQVAPELIGCLLVAWQA